MSQADEIRKYVKEFFIVPARKKGLKEIIINAYYVDKGMKLGRVPAVNSVLRGKKLQEMCGIKLKKTEGNIKSTTGTYTYEIFSSNQGIVEEEPSVIEGETNGCIKSKMFCPVHQTISSGYLRIENSRPILICGNDSNCIKPFEINWDTFLFDTNVLANGLFSDLSNIDFFKGKTILISETVTDEISNWKKPNHKNYGLYKIAFEEMKKIRFAYDQRKLVFKIIGTDPTYKQLIEKGRPDKIIAGDANKHNAIVITSDKDFLINNPDVSIIIYKYEPPRKGEILEVKIVEEYKGYGIGYYKNYRISITGACNKIGNKVTAEIIEVVSDKTAASGKIVIK